MEVILYKGYRAQPEFDKEDNIFHATVTLPRDIVSFHGDSLFDLKVAFQKAIDSYLEHCYKIDKEPEKTP